MKWIDKRIITNFVSLLAIQIGNYLVPLIQTPYLVRVLGPGNYGQVSFAMACGQYIGTLAEYGFNLTGTRRLAIAKVHGEDAIAEVFWRITWAKIFMALFGILVMTGLIFLSHTLYGYRYLIWIFCGWALGVGLFPVWYYQGIERMAVITAVNISAKVLVLPMTLIFVRTAEEGWIYALIYSGVSLAASALGFVTACREVGRFRGPSVKRIYEELKDGLSMFFAVFGASVFQTTNAIVIGFVAGDVAVGIFVGADKFVRAALGLIGPVHSAIYPRLSAQAASGRKSAAAVLRMFLKWEVPVALLVSVTIAVLARPIVMWFLGPKFVESIPLLQVMSFLFFANAMSSTFGTLTLLPFGEQKAFTRIFIGSAFLHLGSLGLLVPFFGPMGAAISVVASEIIIALAMLAVILKKRLLAKEIVQEASA